jgi:hypothetical protein
MIKRILDIISLASVAVLIGVLLWAAIWGEGPRAPGHLSIQSKIVVWDFVPIMFGFNWLIYRFAKIGLERFPRQLASFTKILVGIIFCGLVVLSAVFALEILLTRSSP